MDIKKEYYDYLRNIIQLDSDYNNLIDYLYSTEFKTVVPDDNNRAIDGMDLRYRFLYEAGADEQSAMIIKDTELAGPCTVLEMMIALAIKMDEELLYDWELGPRQHIWFYQMLKSMHIDKYTNDRFEDILVYKAVTDMMLYNIAANGSGGLFTFRNVDIDARDLSIWYQMNHYVTYELN